MDELDALLAEIQGGGLTREEWIKEGRAYYAENKSLKGWKNKTWVNPETGESFILTSKTRRGQTKPDDGSSYTPKSVKAQSKQGANRKGREAVPERLRSKFNSDEEFQAFKDYVKKGNSQNQKLASKAGELGTDFNKGHIKSLAQGGSHDPADQRLESAEGNKSSISFEDPSDESLRATGQATNWDEAVQYYKEGRPENYFKLTPQDKQRIWKGENPDVVISQRDAAIAQNPLARPAPSRFTRLGTVPANVEATARAAGAARGLNKAQMLALSGALPGIVMLPLQAQATEEAEQRAELDPTWKNKLQAYLERVSLEADKIDAVVPNPVSGGVSNVASLGSAALDVPDAIQRNQENLQSKRDGTYQSQVVMPKPNERFGNRVNEFLKDPIQSTNQGLKNAWGFLKGMLPEPPDEEEQRMMDNIPVPR